VWCRGKAARLRRCPPWRSVSLLTSRLPGTPYVCFSVPYVCFSVCLFMCLCVGLRRCPPSRSVSLLTSRFHGSLCLFLSVCVYVSVSTPACIRCSFVPCTHNTHRKTKTQTERNTHTHTHTHTHRYVPYNLIDQLLCRLKQGSAAMRVSLGLF